MRKMLGALVIAGALLVCGCSSGNALSGVGGAAVGAAAGAGTYEYHLSKMRDQVAADFAAKKIDRREHDIRMNQIDRDSVF